MAKKDSKIQVSFPKLGHFWLDSGLLGLYVMSCNKINEQPFNVDIEARDDSIVFIGEKKALIEFFWECSQTLMDKYYNISNKEQRGRNEAIIYNSKKDKFERHPRRGPYGISKLVFNSKASAIYGKLTVKKKEKIVDENYKQLSDSLTDFLSKEGLKLNYNDKEKAPIPIDTPFYYLPIRKEDIKVGTKGRSQNNCFICGSEKMGSIEIGNPVFPVITGSSGVLSFNSNVGKPEKVCWKCALLGKFVPINGFFFINIENKTQNIYTFFPYSFSLKKMIDVYQPLHDAENWDPYFFRNFEHPLGGYFQHSFEVTFAFLYTLYQKVLLEEKGDKEGEAPVLDWESLYNIAISKAPLEFVVLHTRSESSTFACKMLWPFRNSVYFYRLINLIEQSGINIRELMRLLVNWDEPKNENKTLIRNRVCECILKKRTILDLVEYHVYNADLGYFKPLLDFLLIYESELRKEDDSMNKEEQDAAVTLGKRIGAAVGGSDNGKKGDLFSLRKTRKKVDFLEQLNRLQFKLGNDFVVPPDIYQGSLTDENFAEFKQFCMIAALNSYNAAQSSSSKDKEVAN